MKKILLLSGLLIGATFTFAQSKINTAKSTVTFKLSGPEGTLNKLSGTVKFDEAKLSESSFDVKIPVAVINTGVAARDKHLKSDDFFDAEKYPKITFKSKGATKEGDKYVTKGKLSFHGVTKDAKIVFTYNKASKKFEGKMTVNAPDFGVGKGKKYENAQVTIVCYLL